MIRLYDTRRREKVEFTPIDAKNVRLYVCGPTVYDDAHIGNARPVIVFDLLFRLLRHTYGETHVNYARNITDVDDKINLRAHERGITIRELTDGTNARFQAACAALGSLEPTVQPRATDHIEGMKAIIERLIARGVAYVAEEHVLFNVPAMAGLAGVPRYGALARRTLDDMLAGARVDVAPYKRDAMDFVLWKPSRAAHEPGWPSPAGIATPGRPGWHIECSAMSMAELLEPFGGGLTCDDPTKNVFDIHGGGIDLTFPHHENEVAQSCCAFGTEVMANVWMHNGFLQVEGEKMSKSLGNFVTIDELLNTDKFGGRSWAGDVLRYAMLQTNYRQPIDWTLTRLEAAEGTLLDWGLWRRDIEQTSGSKIDFNDSAKADAEFIAALSDDLNTPKAIARLHVLANQARLEGDVAKTQAFFSSLALTGLSHLPKNEKVGIDNEISTMVEPLIEARLAARRAKNFTESDRIRDELLAKGIQLKDGKDPVTGEPITTWEMKR